MDDRQIHPLFQPMEMTPRRRALIERLAREAEANGVALQFRAAMWTESRFIRSDEVDWPPDGR